MISPSYFSTETKFGSRYDGEQARQIGAGGGIGDGARAGSRTHRNASVHGAAPHSPVHSSRRGRNENAICISRTKKNTKLP